VEPGWHFGSAFRATRIVAVYDFLPDVLLEQVSQCPGFSGRPGVRQMDGKRRRPPGDLLPCTRPIGYVAQMMDHGYVFDGPHWDFPDSPLQGLIFPASRLPASGFLLTISSHGWIV